MRHQGTARHLATPRVLLFLERDGRRLFIEGAPHKWWAGRLNGLGGSVESGEGVRAAAVREAEEECGLRPARLELAAVGHVVSVPPVLLFVFTGSLPPGALRPTGEGRHRWLAPADLAGPDLPLMPDLPLLLPLLDRRPAGAPPFSYVFDPLATTLTVDG